MKFKEIKKKYKALRHFSLVFVPENPGMQSRSRRMSLSGSLILILSYSVIAGILGFLIFNSTPLKNVIFPVKEISNSDRKMMIDLNDKLLYMNLELEKIRSTNYKLKKAAMFKDSLIIKPGGNIYTVIMDFFDKFSSNQDLKITFINPVSGYISRSFIPEKGHIGIDYVLKTGTPVYSTAAGYVLFSDYTTKEGFVIIIVHPDNYISFYKHCSSLIKKERDNVRQGELIALSGNSGEVSSGPHLHLEIWKNGKPIDPLSIIINNKEIK